ncbi:hypothetical protein GQ54DRAFT_259568 [Martensiomyces pterosporus]|nr:hypothetical protein GQ54DRAFT_259568 [Martensiomyces pterosporus]
MYLLAGHDTDSLKSLDTYISVDSVNSRACLLNERPRMSLDASTGEGLAVCQSEGDSPPCWLSESDRASRQEDLESILLRQARTQDPAMTSQRVVLTSSMKRDMQVAQVMSVVSRMGALRYSNQDCASEVDRRASDMEGFLRRLDRLSVDKLADEQRYAPVNSMR